MEVGPLKKGFTVIECVFVPSSHSTLRSNQLKTKLKQLKTKGHPKMS